MTDLHSLGPEPQSHCSDHPPGISVGSIREEASLAISGQGVCFWTPLCSSIYLLSSLPP